MPGSAPVYDGPSVDIETRDADIPILDYACPSLRSRAIPDRARRAKPVSFAAKSFI